MFVRAALVALAIGLSPPYPPAAAVSVIPDEPGAIVLPDAQILQAVVADLDGDGSRELIRLVSGEGDAALAEVWQLGTEGWALADEPIQVLPPARTGPRVDPVYAGVPLRMLVHRVGGIERVLVASQPRFEEIDSGPACCLVLHELVLDAGGLSRVAVAQPTDPVDGILAIDLDGDLTDELLTSRSLPPLGGISFPTEARVYRWVDGAFAAPTVSELPVGSGDSPMPIGDSDGRPGDEAAFISTLGPRGLYRIMRGESDELTVDEFGPVVEGARGVPLGDGSVGIATISGDLVSVDAWPAFGSRGATVAGATVRYADSLGSVAVDGEPLLVVHLLARSSLRLLPLPDLTSGPVARVAHSAAAETLVGLPLRPYSGALPGGGADGEGAVLHAGTFLSSTGGETMATLPGAEPVGLAADRSWLAMLHTPHGAPSVAASGGRFEPLIPRADAWLSIAPLGTVLTSELDDGLLEPVLEGARHIDGQSVATGRPGFSVEVRAPAGSRVLGTDLDSSVVRAPLEVPIGGVLSVPVVPSAVMTPNPRYRTAVIVVTPAGHGYVATWDVHVLTEPPPLALGVRTPFGSSQVMVSGETSPLTSVVVGGHVAPVSDQGRFGVGVPLPPWPTDVEVVAVDFAGNTTRSIVSGVGIFDYRGLPWIPIVIALVAVAGVALYLRVPRAREAPAVEDDAVFQELDPTDSL